MVVTPLLMIELKATSNDNTTNSFYCWQKSSFLDVAQCNTIGRRIIFHRPNLYSLTGKFEQPGYVGLRPIGPILFLLTLYEPKPIEFRLIPKFISRAGSKPNTKILLRIHKCTIINIFNSIWAVVVKSIK